MSPHRAAEFSWEAYSAWRAGQSTTQLTMCILLSDELVVKTEQK
jgi:hypothetical protein